MAERSRKTSRLERRAVGGSNVKLSRIVDIGSFLGSDIKIGARHSAWPVRRAMWYKLVRRGHLFCPTHLTRCLLEHYKCERKRLRCYQLIFRFDLRPLPSVARGCWSRLLRDDWLVACKAALTFWNAGKQPAQVTSRAFCFPKVATRVVTLPPKFPLGERAPENAEFVPTE